MRPEIVVIGAIGLEDLTQVGLAKDHDVIQAFSTDRANQPLRMPILPGWPRRNRVIPDAHRRQTLGYGMAVGSVAVAYEMGGRTIPWEGFGNLPRDPFRCRMVGDAQRDQASPLMPQNDQDEQQSKVDRRNYKQVHCADTGHMIAQERLPSLARPGPTLGHVLGDGRLSD